MSRCGAPPFCKFMKNKILYSCLYVLSLLLIVTSCGEKKSSSISPIDEKTEFISGLRGADTIEVMTKSKKCMDILKTGRIRDAVGMLHEINDETGEISPISEELRARLETRFSIFPVIDYEIESFSFSTEKDNEIVYRITFEEVEKDEAPATIRFQWSPVKIDGVWYLTVKQ